MGDDFFPVVSPTVAGGTWYILGGREFGWTFFWAHHGLHRHDAMMREDSRLKVGCDISVFIRDDSV